MIEITYNGIPFKRTPNLYGANLVQELLNNLINMGYEIHQFAPEGVGYGSLVCIAPDTGKYYCYVIEEVYLNCWSSGHKVRRVRFERIGKRIWDAVDKYAKEEYKNG